MADESRLYGQDGDEHLSLDLDDAIEDYAQSLDSDAEFEVCEFSVLPPGQYGGVDMPDGAWLAERVAEDICDECGFDDLAEQIASIAKDPDVIAAFQAALDLMASSVTFLVADKVVARHRFVTYTDDDGGLAWRPVDETTERITT